MINIYEIKKKIRYIKVVLCVVYLIIGLIFGGAAVILYGIINKCDVFGIPFLFAISIDILLSVLCFFCYFFLNGKLGGSIEETIMWFMILFIILGHIITCIYLVINGSIPIKFIDIGLLIVLSIISIIVILFSSINNMGQIESLNTLNNNCNYLEKLIVTNSMIANDYNIKVIDNNNMEEKIRIIGGRLGKKYKEKKVETIEFDNCIPTYVPNNIHLFSCEGVDDYYRCIREYAKRNKRLNKQMVKQGQVIESKLERKKNLVNEIDRNTQRVGMLESTKLDNIWKETSLKSFKSLSKKSLKERLLK